MEVLSAPVPLVGGIGSSIRGTRVEVRDADTGDLVASSWAPHPATAPPRSEQPPETWWTALAAAVHQTGRRDLAAVSVAAPPGLVCIDSAGSALRPAKLWNDTQAADDAIDLCRHLDPDRWVRLCGAVPSAALSVAKVAWLARVEPEVLQRTSRLLAPHDYLTFRLTGRPVTDRGDASGTGYWSPWDERWRGDVLARIVADTTADDWVDRLPDILAADEPADWVSASVHEQLGLRGRPLVGAGTGIPMAAALAVGLEPGDLLLHIDEGGAVATVSDDPVAAAEGPVGGGADATGRFLPHVTTANAWLAIEAVARMFGVTESVLAARALTAPVGAGGLVFLPHIDGDSRPGRAAEHGILAGLSRELAPATVARAAYEGVVCDLLEGVDALHNRNLIGERPFVLTGAGAASDALAQLAADLSGSVVVVPSLPDAAATGAAVQAAALVHQQPPQEVATHWGLGAGPVVEPSPSVEHDAAEARAAYRAASAHHVESGNDLKEHRTRTRQRSASRRRS